MTIRQAEPRIEVTRAGGDTRVRFAGVTGLSEEHVESLGRQLAALTEGRLQRLVLDLANVEFVGSSAVGKLVHLHNSLVAAGGSLAVANARPAVRDVFAITGLNELLGVRPA